MKKLLLVAFVATIALGCKKETSTPTEELVNVSVRMYSFPYKLETQKNITLLDGVKVQTPGDFKAKKGSTVEAHVWNDYHPTTTTRIEVVVGGKVVIDDSQNSDKPITRIITVN